MHYHWQTLIIKVLIELPCQCIYFIHKQLCYYLHSKKKNLWMNV